MAVGAVYYVVQATASDGDLLDLDNIELSQSSLVVATDPDTGAQVEYETLRSSNSHRVWADLEQIPANLQYAFICTEDKDFYNEPGVNFKRTIGAMINEYILPIYSSKQGASTLEQQLIKNLTSDKSASGIEGALRKLREIYRALCLSRTYSKETVLEAYLNTISFTGTIQGVQTAANEYFNKDVSQLTLWECASIASITKNPTNYNPYTNPENLIHRRNFILYNMWQQGVITEEDYRNAAAQPLVLAEDTSKKNTSSVTSYFTDALFNEVVRDIMAKEGVDEATAQNMLYTGGYSIYCTVDPEIQSIVESVYADRNNLNYTSSKGQLLQSGATIIDNTTGDIVAVAGRVGEREGRFLLDYSTVVRQCGSAIKPLSTYAPALDDGTINGASVIDDYPMLLNGDVWPRNDNWRYQGLMPLHLALRQSLNTCAVRINLAYGVTNSYDFLVNKLGFKNLTYTDSQQVGNMALGGFEKGVTTEEMAAGFATFVNEGVYTAPRTFIRVEDANGNVILENEAQSTVAMKNTTAALMNSLLQEASLQGTGYQAQFPGMHIAGKTGSTNSNKDRYFAGYTPYYSCAVWAGYEHNQRIVASGNPCAVIFQKVMKAIHEDLPDKDFFSCAGLTSVAVCADSGMLASENCALDVRGSRVYTALVAADNAPTAVCTMHTAPTYTVNMADSDGNVTTVTGSVLNYQRELIEGHDEIVVEDAFMMLGGWNGFFGDEADDDFNMPDGDHDDTTDPNNRPETDPNAGIGGFLGG